MWREASICAETSSLTSDALNLLYKTLGDIMPEVLMKFGISPCGKIANSKLPGNLPNSLKKCEYTLSKSFALCL